MRCEIVAIGTELLLGQIVDTNSSWIGEQLALVGIDSHFQVKVGDNFDRMERTIRHALERSDAVICCGGLGPTQDDITREVIAAIMGVELHRDEAVVAKIRDMFESRGRVMVDNNRRQADIPEGASLIAQMPGTAPGLVCPIGDKVIYAVPGVPHEMRTMMDGTVLADLQRRSGETAVIRSRVLRTWGDSESGLAERLADRIDQLDGLGNPTLAFQASGMEGIKVRITAKAVHETAAAEIISAEETLLRGLLGDVIFGVDEESMETVVLNLLEARGLTLAIAEGMTGGVLSARLSEIDHGLTVFRGGAVRGEMEDGERPGADSAAAAAIGARRDFGTDVGLAVTAARAHDEQPPGTVFMNLAMGEAQYAQTVSLPGDRARFRNYAVINVLNFLRKTLMEQ
ncbi:MAG: CinA family nicotinamide mononucleotide deamidase-related protein [Rhodospirillaceae bacterium]|nr:CinA family nicotinamide mononucleotide deamidase-related protein [Rhodospirillaceae bacterium]MBT6429902.1 CinA family nicotinamide mononucleotide deamidase-related protein [Rhodospirillaceae bacterium]